MRILIASQGVADQSLIGGPGRVAIAHANLLVARGHQVELLTNDLIAKSRRHPQPTFDLVDEGVSLTVLPARTLPAWPGTVGPVWSPGLGKVARRLVERVDVAHCHEWPNFLTHRVRAAAAEQGKPSVVQPHGSIQVRRGWKRVMHQGFSRLNPPGPTDHFIVGSEAEGAEVLGELSGIRTVYRLVNPMPLSTLDKAADDVARVRQSWEVDPGDKVLLYAHRIVENKGLDLLIEALENLPEHYRLVAVGESTEFAKRCLELTEQRGLTERVQVLPPVGQQGLDALILASDVFVLPARRDTFPLMVLHALACGQPTVITDTCQSSEKLKGAVVTCPPTPEGLAEAIGSIDDRTAEALSARASELLLGEYVPDAVGRRLEEIYAMAVDAAKAVAAVDRA